MSLFSTSGGGFEVENEILAQIIVAVQEGAFDHVNFNVAFNLPGCTATAVEAQLRRKGIEVDDILICMAYLQMTLNIFIQAKSNIKLSPNDYDFAKVFLQVVHDIKLPSFGNDDKGVLLYCETETTNSTVKMLQDLLDYAHSSNSWHDLLSKLNIDMKKKLLAFYDLIERGWQAGNKRKSHEDEEDVEDQEEPQEKKKQRRIPEDDDAKSKGKGKNKAKRSEETEDGYAEGKGKGKGQGKGKGKGQGKGNKAKESEESQAIRLRLESYPQPAPQATLQVGLLSQGGTVTTTTVTSLLTFTTSAIPSSVASASGPANSASASGTAAIRSLKPAICEETFRALRAFHLCKYDLKAHKRVVCQPLRETGKETEAYVAGIHIARHMRENGGRFDMNAPRKGLPLEVYEAAKILFTCHEAPPKNIKVQVIEEIDATVQRRKDFCDTLDLLAQTHVNGEIVKAIKFKYLHTPPGRNSGQPARDKMFKTAADGRKYHKDDIERIAIPLYLEVGEKLNVWAYDDFDYSAYNEARPKMWCLPFTVARLRNVELCDLTDEQRAKLLTIPGPPKYQRFVDQAQQQLFNSARNNPAKHVN